jgi:uncharacterized membrane protein YkoI
MRYLLLSAVFVLTVGSSVWAASDKELALSAAISMEEAIKAAGTSVPGGKPYQVEMTKKKGQAVYQVDIVDSSKKTHKVYIDASNGKIIVDQ